MLVSHTIFFYQLLSSHEGYYRNPFQISFIEVLQRDFSLTVTGIIVFLIFQSVAAGRLGTIVPNNLFESKGPHVDIKIQRYGDQFY